MASTRFDLMGKTRTQISYNMSQVRSSGSEIERVLGAALWREGLRYRKQYKTISGRPDFVLVALKIAIFCDSSFWHGRGWPEAADAIKTNKVFWVNKIEYNIRRDCEVNELLADLGWNVLRFWDDEILKQTRSCVQRVQALVNERRNTASHEQDRSDRLFLRRGRHDERTDPIGNARACRGR